MAENEKKLFLLDAYALIYRAYFAFGKNHRYNSKGLNTSAVLGFTNTLLEVLEKQKPSHIAVVFDAPGGSESRNEDFTEYKANREAMPEDIRKSLPYIKQLLEAFNIPAIQSEGYEADDIIGTLSVKAEEAGFITYMMTPDKDFAQLVTENVFMFKPARSGKPSEVMGVKEVCENFQVKDPKQVIDILGLWGDSVDNIPGIPGIGEKTAKKLISEYGSMENIFANVEDLKGKQKENVIEFQEQGLMSKQLATIILDVPVEFEPDKLILEKPNEELIKDLFGELEFRTLAKRVLGEEIAIKQAESGQMDLFGNVAANSTNSETEETIELVESKTIEDVEHNYQLVASKEQRQSLIQQLEQTKSFCFDTETTGLDALLAEVIGVAFSAKKHTGYYVPLPENQGEAKAILQEFKPLLENENIEKIAHNLKYDQQVLKKYDIEIKGPKFDTMLAHYLIQPDMKHGMDVLSETYLNYKPISIETLIGKKGKKQLSMRSLEPEQVYKYAAEDADVTFQLKESFEPKINEEHLKKLFYEIEMPVLDVLNDIECEGINLDVEALKKFSIELEESINGLQKNIIEIAGTEFNIDSPKQLGQILFEVLVITDKPKKTKTGQYSTSEDILLKLENKHEIVAKILEYRSLRKLKSTYIDTLPKQVNPNTGRIHTNYLQTVAATGRLSSNNPNLQNIPIKTEKGRETRKAFIPKNRDYVLLAADYSQIELRIIAALSNDENMKNAFIAGEDIHSATAAKVFGVKQEEVTREMRIKSKAVNFGIIYGQTAFGLSQALNIPRKEAKEIIDNYFNQYPKIGEYIENSQQFAKENGYVETIMKRRRYLKDINSGNAIVRGHAERNAINAPIQGSAADVIKIAMINIHNKLEESDLKSKMLLQVHDELVFDVPKDEIEEMKVFVKTEMENAVKLDVPLEVEVGVGENWLKAH